MINDEVAVENIVDVQLASDSDKYSGTLWHFSVSLSQLTLKRQGTESFEPVPNLYK
jgi:hypothetical protein